MAINIVSLAMMLLRNRDEISKIAAVLPELQKIFAQMNPATPPPAETVPVVNKPGSVKWLQESLNTLMNAGLEVDGEYGPATTKAVAAYQKKYGLEVDGWAGPETVNSIINELNKK